MSVILANFIPFVLYMFIGISLTFIYNIYMLKKGNKKKEIFKSKHNLRKFYSLINND